MNTTKYAVELIKGPEEYQELFKFFELSDLIRIIKEHGFSYIERGSTLYVGEEGMEPLSFVLHSIQ